MELSARGLDPAFVREWGALFLAAWNARDPAAVAALCTEDVVWRDPSMAEPVTGRGAVRAFAAATARAFPDMRIAETAAPAVTGRRALAPYRMTGTMLGAMEGFAPTGRRVSVDGVDEWMFRDGLLCEYGTYYDTVDAARQLGIMPAPGSAAGRAMLRLQHLQARVQRGVARPAIAGGAWRLWYAGWRRGPVAADSDRPVFVSVTDFHIARARHAPGAWLSGLRLRRAWPQIDGAIGLWLWAEPLRLRSGSVSVWRGREEFDAFLASPRHRAVVGAHRTRMRGASSSWTEPRFDRQAIWWRAVGELRR